ncbi:MAG: peptidylprolyl isomerase [Desulfobacterales bacterium]|nr:peptidylprolyl isomerase [Desulfobacterales bacterium]
MRLIKVLCVVFGLSLFISTPLLADDETAEAKKVDEKKILAKVGDEEITMDNFEAVLTMVPPQYRQQLTTPQAKGQLLNQIIEGMLLAKEARRLELDKQPKTRYMLKSAADQVLIKELVQEIQAGVKISEEDIKAYYDQNQAKFQSPPEIKARHILVKNEEEAKEIRTALDNGGVFEDLAKEKSVGPSKDKGGDLGWFGKGRMVPAFEEAAFAMKKGEISQPVKTRFGWHIIQVEDSRPAAAKPLEQAKAQIHSSLLQEKTKAAMKEIRERLEKEVKIEITPGVFESN